MQTRDGATLVFLLQCLCWSHSVSLLFLIVFALSAIFQSRQNVDPEIKPEQKRAETVTTTEAHIVSDDNTEPVLYMTTAQRRPTSQPQRTCERTHQQPIRRPENPKIQPPLISFVFWFHLTFRVFIQDVQQDSSALLYCRFLLRR